jgi:hypothetical protein
LADFAVTDMDTHTNERLTFRTAQHQFGCRPLNAFGSLCVKLI